MPLPICLEIPELGDPPVITLPGGVSIQQFNLMEAIQPALTPLMPVFDIIDTVVAVFNCVKAIPDSLGPPPDPTALAACIPELAEKVSKLLKLIPQLSLPYTIIGMLAERRFGRVRAFVNLENLTNVRQSDYNPLLLPSPTVFGQCAVDAWAPLDGRTINAGVRIGF